MGIVLTEVILPMKTGIPQDSVVNTFVFRTPATAIVDADLDNIKTDLTAFYNGVHAGNTTASRMSSALVTGTATDLMKHYDISGHLDGSPHGSPLRIDTWTLGATGATAAPNELAACLSFHSDYGTDVEFGTGTRPRARDRGRIYFGPLAQNAMQVDATTSQVTLALILRSTLAAAGAALRDSAATEWMLWSRKKATVFPVVGGWCDDAFDIQRRRGVKATARGTF